MELKDFVAESLNQIIDAVSTAQKHAQVSGAFINPPDDHALSSAPTKIGNMRFGRIPGKGPHSFLIQDVEFDIAVTVSSSAESKGGIGVLASVVTIGGSKGKTNEIEQASRLKFSVPVAFPHHPLKPTNPAQSPAPLSPSLPGPSA